MEAPEKEDRDLRSQAREIREGLQPTAWVSSAARPPSFRFWFTTSLILVVAVLSYFLIPAVRERVQGRVEVLVSGSAGPGQEGGATVAQAPPVQDSPLLRGPTEASVPAMKVEPPAPGASQAPPEPSRQKVAQGIPPRSIPETAPAREPARRRGAPVLQRGDRSEDQSKAMRVDTTEASPERAPATVSVTTPHADEAYKILLDRIPRMAAIAGKTDEEFHMKSWTVVRADEIEVWIDLLATRVAGGGEEHFVWKIHLNDLAATPLSQSARRLTAK